MSGAKAYKLLRADRAANKSVSVGQIVYYCRGHDYGCASEDTRYTGIHHVSVTLDPTGDYPFFTVPREDLEAAGEQA